MGAEEDLSGYLNKLYNFLGDGPEKISHKVVDEIHDAHDNGEPEVSLTLDDLAELLDGTIKFSDAAVKTIETEKKRRVEAPLRSPNDPLFIAKVNALRESDENTWPTLQKFSQGLRV